MSRYATMTRERFSRTGAAIAVAALTAAAGSLSGGCETSVVGFLEAKHFGDLTRGTAPRTAYRESLVRECGPGRVTDRGAEVFQRYPYLSSAAPTWAEVRWKSAASDVHTLELTESSGNLLAQLTVVAETDLDTTLPIMRRARLVDLAPDSVYCYAVRDARGELLERKGFRTGAVHGTTGTTEILRFAALGDLGWRTSDQAAVYHQLAKVPIDTVVLTGDIAYPNGTTDQLDDNFFAIYHEMLGHVPFVVASGNHDIRTREGMPLFGAFGMDYGYFSRDVGPVHFVVLDSTNLTIRQLEWLDEDLATNRLPWVVVAMHHPPYSSGHHGNNAEVQQLLEPLLRKHRVPLVLAGHEHNYERTRPIDGVHYVITGGGGRGTRPVGSSWFTAHSAQVAHFVHFTVVGDVLTMRAIDAIGETFDTAVIYRET